VTQDNPGAVRAPPPEAFPTDQVPIPDRWRLIETLGIVKERWFDPYHQNTLKGDRPLNPERVPLITGNDWFFATNLVSDTVLEPRTFPIPVGVQTTARPGSLDVFGKDASYVVSQTFIAGAALIKGSTAFKPPEIEYRLTLALNLNYANVPERRVLFVEPSKGTDRFDHFLGVQEAFVDYHIRNVSERYDFDSVRVGIQPFQADFRGFLFNDQQLGVRLFGNRDNNRFQYNLAAFWRLAKDTNSGLNAVLQRPRDDFLFIANVYRQDFPDPGADQPGYGGLQREPRRRRDRGGRQRLPGTPGAARHAARAALRCGLPRLQRRRTDRAPQPDRESLRRARRGPELVLHRPAGRHPRVLRRRRAQLRPGLDALSPVGAWAKRRRRSVRRHRGRVRRGASRNPIFAGADTSYWIRQVDPLRRRRASVSLNGRNGILNSLRSSKEEGQSNFNNPGLMLLGAGGDFDPTPDFRLSANANHLWFENTATLQALRVEGSIPKDIGWDLSPRQSGAQGRRRTRVSAFGARCWAGDGFRDLFDETGGGKSLLFRCLPM
jgi:hypothetical protein